MMLKLDCCFTTDVGKVRTNNEDNFYLNGDYKRAPEEKRYEKKDFIYERGLFAVCDGMGGEEYGERASLLAVKTLKEFEDADMGEQLDTYVNMANQRVCDLITENNGIRSGTTLALVYIEDGQALCCNIGDSRIYLFRDKKLRQLSEDHTRSMQMVKLGVLTKKQAMTHKDRHVLTQYLGIFPEEMIIQGHRAEPVSVRQGDIFLLCSDGLTDMVSDRDISDILRADMPAEDCAAALRDAALSGGGRDNVTVGVIKNAERKKRFFNRFGGR